MTWWDPEEIHERPWPGPDGTSVEYEIGGRGMAAPVTVLAKIGKSGGYVSCRKLTHVDATVASNLADCLQTAYKIINERHT